MGWSQVVHDNRKRAELSRALDEYRMRKRGYDIDVSASAGLPAVAALLGALAGAVWWRKEGRKPHGRDWHTIPVLEQLLAVINGGKKPSRATARGKAKPKQSAKAAVLRAASATPAGSITSSKQLQIAAAPQPAQIAQRQAPSATTSSSSTSKSKKKKSKKKK